MVWLPQMLATSAARQSTVTYAAWAASAAIVFPCAIVAS